MFEQEAWLETYITLNTKRQQARNKFEEDLYKLLKNCAYRKTCESKRKRMLVRKFRVYQAALREISAFEFKSYKTFEKSWQRSHQIQQNFIGMCRQLWDLVFVN